MTTKELLNLTTSDFNKLFTTENESEAQKAVRALAQAANKRLKRFKAVGEESPATVYIEKNGGWFSSAVKSMSLNELRQEYSRARGFLSSETGNIRSWRKIKQKTIESLRKQNIHLDDNNWELFWKSYEKLKEINPGVSTRELKYRVLDKIEKLTENKSYSKRNVNKIVKEINKQVSDIYESQEEKKNEMDSVSDFFRG